MVPRSLARRAPVLLCALSAMAAVWAFAPAVAQADDPCLPPLVGCTSPTPPAQPGQPAEPSQPAASSPATAANPATPAGQSGPAAAPSSTVCPPKVGSAGPFVGINAQDPLLNPVRFRNCGLNALVRAHVGILREVFYWAGIEVAPGGYDFGVQDSYVANAARHGLQVLPVLLMAPGFRSTAPTSGSTKGFYPPRNPADMGDFAAVLAKRYGPGGEFWREHPELPNIPIRSWQIWNEPNLPVYWVTGPDPEAYTQLLRAAAEGIHRVDPAADIVSAGLPYSKDRRTLSPERFLSGMYAAGAKGLFTTLAVHPYSDTVGRMVSAIKRMRRVLNAAGDSAVPIWITEVGWATGGPRSAFTVSKRRQAQLIGKTVRTLARKRSSLGVKGLVIHNLRDSRPGPGDHDYWGFHAGLFDRKGKAKPAMATLRTAAKRVGG